MDVASLLIFPSYDLMDREETSSFGCATSVCYSRFLVMSELHFSRCSKDILAMTGMKERE